MVDNENFSPMKNGIPNTIGKDDKQKVCKICEKLCKGVRFHACSNLKKKYVNNSVRI